MKIESKMRGRKLQMLQTQFSFQKTQVIQVSILCSWCVRVMINCLSIDSSSLILVSLSFFFSSKTKTKINVDSASIVSLKGFHLVVDFVGELVDVVLSLLFFVVLHDKRYKFLKILFISLSFPSGVYVCVCLFTGISFEV